MAMERKRWPYMQYEWMAIDSKGTTVFDGRTGKRHGMLDPAYVKRLVARLLPREAEIVLLWPMAKQLAERLGFGFATTGVAPEERAGHTRFGVEISGYGYDPTGPECLKEAKEAAKLLFRMLRKAGLDAEMTWDNEKERTEKSSDYQGEYTTQVKYCGAGYVYVFLENQEEFVATEEVIRKWSTLKVNGLAVTGFIPTEWTPGG